MSQLSISIPQQSKKLALAVSFRVLLGLYGIIPLCLLLQLSDRLFFEQSLLEKLPSAPAHFILFQILFGTPHIIASSLLLATNSDYLSFYKNRLIGISLFIIIVFGIGSLFIPYKILYIITACWTVYHVLKQQHGVARGICRLPNREFYLQLWLSILAGIFIYIGIFLKNSLSVQQQEWIKYIAAGLTLGLILSTFLAQRYIKNTLGYYFLWANTLLIMSSFYLFIESYYFLAILIPRLVHDATAYIFYLTHDYNKHASQPQNSLYQLAKRCNIHIFFVLPVLSLFLTVILQLYGDNIVRFISQFILGFEIRKTITLGLIGYLSLMHYYSEAFMWKNGSPLRQFIHFK